MVYVDAALTVDEDGRGGDRGQPKCPFKMGIVHIKSGTFFKGKNQITV